MIAGVTNGDGMMAEEGTLHNVEEEGPGDVPVMLLEDVADSHTGEADDDHSNDHSTDLLRDSTHVLVDDEVLDDGASEGVACQADLGNRMDGRDALDNHNNIHHVDGAEEEAQIGLPCHDCAYAMILLLRWR